jgi:hypothetical protein
VEEVFNETLDTHRLGVVLSVSAACSAFKISNLRLAVESKSLKLSPIVEGTDRPKRKKNREVAIPEMVFTVSPEVGRLGLAGDSKSRVYFEVSVD